MSLTQQILYVRSNQVYKLIFELAEKFEGNFHEKILMCGRCANEIDSRIDENKRFNCQ